MDECRRFLESIPELITLKAETPEHALNCNRCKNEWELYFQIISNLKESELPVDVIALKKMEDRVIALTRKPKRYWNLATAASILLIFIASSLFFMNKSFVKTTPNNGAWSKDAQVEAALLLGYGENNISDLLFDYANFEIKNTGKIKEGDLPITPNSYNYGGNTWLLSD